MKKQPKDAVGYEDPAKGGDHCGDCKHFIVPNACRLVEGRIMRSGWCKLYKEKGELKKRGIR